MADFYALKGEEYGRLLFDMVSPGKLDVPWEDLTDDLQRLFRRAACKLIERFVTEAQVSIGDRGIVLQDPKAYGKLMEALKHEWDHGLGVYYIP